MKKLHLPLHESKVTVAHPKTGKATELLQNTFGVLSEDQENALSAVSVANSSLSIDIWKGCAWQCAYCHIQGSTRNLDETGVMPRSTEKIVHFSINEILEALEKHPYFVLHQSILSIGTASTEPLAPGKVQDSTFEIMRNIQGRKWKNPIWVVTKGNIVDANISAVQDICKTNTLILSPTLNALDRTIEPIQNNRLKNLNKAAEAGAKIVLYLRPLVRPWGTTEEKVTRILEDARKELSTTEPAAIVTGGLRWTEGIEYGLKLRDIHWPEALNQKENEKDMDEALWQHVVSTSKNLFPNVPVVLHSSCSISTILQQSDLSMIFTRVAQECQESTCSHGQRHKCEQAKYKMTDQNLSIRNALNQFLTNIGTPVTVTHLDDSATPVTEPIAYSELPYAIRRSLIKVIADSIKTT